MNKSILKGIGIAVLVSIPIIFLIEKLSAKKSSSQSLNLNGRKLVIGDSHAVGIGKATRGVEVDTRIAVGGWMLSSLINALQSYPTSPDVTVIFISIGTNGQFSSSDKIEDLVSVLHQKFPNATLFIFKGSYGWSGTRTTQQILDRMNPYYQRFASAGVIVMQNGLGYFLDGGQAHTTSTLQSQAIVKEIENIIKL
jgi:hypothetical protein